MYGYFGEGERRLLTDGLADEAELGSLDGVQYATAEAIAYDPILIGTDPGNGEYVAGAFANGTVNPTVSGFSGAWRGATATWKITPTGRDYRYHVGFGQLGLSTEVQPWVKMTVAKL